MLKNIFILFTSHLLSYFTLKTSSNTISHGHVHTVPLTRGATWTFVPPGLQVLLYQGGRHRASGSRRNREYSKTSMTSISAWAGKVFLIEEMMPGRQYLLSMEVIGLPRTKMQRKNKFSLSPLELRCPSSPTLGHQNFWTSDQIIPQDFLVCQLADDILWDFSAHMNWEYKNCVSQFP